MLIPSAPIVFHSHGRTIRVEIVANARQPVIAKVGNKVVWRAMRREWFPWKVLAADVDGDGNQDVLIGLKKLTRHAKHRIHTLYVYGFDGKAFFPKWRGSRLARDFTNFSVLKTDSRDMIVTLDRLLDGRYALSCYSWNGFGFWKKWERGEWKEARLQEAEQGTIAVIAEGKRFRYSTEGKPINP